jgi:Ni/Fe-hydrogenase subunit HybB-like protein
MTTAAGYAHREATHPPNWHGLVVCDMLLNAATTGLFLVTAVGVLARPDVFGPVAAWAFPLALVVLLADLACLVLDLGHRTRFHHMLRVFKPSSPMSLGTWCLTAYSVPLTALAALAVAGLAGWVPTDAGWVPPVRTVLLVVALPFAFGSAAYKGVLFSTTAQPGWRDARWLGAYHIASALAVGCGVLWVLAELVDDGRAAALLRPALAVLAVLALVPTALLAVELRPTLVAVHTPAERTVAAAVLFVDGTALPAGLTFASGIPAAVGAAVSLLATGLVARSLMIRLPHRVHDRTRKSPAA